MVTKYGILSDFHYASVENAKSLVDKLNDNDIDALVLNGNLIGDKFTDKNRKYLALLLNYIGKLNVETYVLPGGSESVSVFSPVVNYFKGKYPNIISTVDNRVISKKDHKLIFLPGSDLRTGDAVMHGYVLDDDKFKNTFLKTGYYSFKNDLESFMYIDIGDLKNEVNNYDPNRVILFSHIPIRFSNPNNGVDVTEFGEFTKDFIYHSNVIKKGSIIPGSIALKIINSYFKSKISAPIKYRKEALI